MNANDHNRKDSNDEAQPRHINPQEVDFKHPGKLDKAQQKIDIKESGFGREQGQTPADEHIEERFSQIDEATAEMHRKEKTDNRHEVGERDVMNTAPRKPNEINSTDNRDHNDSSTDWNAEQNHTGRHK